LKFFKTYTSRSRSFITTLSLKRTLFLFSHVAVWGCYCACEILIVNPIDWLYAACLEYFIFFSIDSSEARKQYDELSVNHANNNLCTWQKACSRPRVDSSLRFKRMELIEVKSLILGAKGETLYNLRKCDVNFRNPPIQIHSSTFLHFYAYVYFKWY
jgi:hypothetical protein